MKMKAEIDRWGHMIAVILAVDLALMGYLTFSRFSASYLIFFLLLAALAAIVFPVYFCTYYLIEDTDLVLRSGFLLRKRIPYTVITQAKKIQDASAACCLSFRRIELKYWEHGEHRTLMIAPEDRDLFQRMLLLKNPLIDIDDNQTRACDMLEIMKHPELLQKKTSMEPEELEKN